ncbi:MAG: hypothetical protein M3Z50_05965 [Actinomycetota bacterium]|nr:hypothetical protein [Actinomycetota bacterium]
MRTFRPLAVALVALAVTSGCGGAKNDRGLSKLSAQQLLHKSRAYVGGDNAVRAKGTVSSTGTKLGLDLNFSGSDSLGTITINGADMDIERLGGTVYFKGSDSFWKAQAGAQAQQIITVINGRWIKADPSAAQLKGLLNLASRKFVTDQVLSPNGTVKKGAPKTVNGVDCLTLSTKDGSLYVDKQDAKPVELVGGSGGSSGKVDFTYTSVTKPSAPAAKDVIDFAKLRG